MTKNSAPVITAVSAKHENESIDTIPFFDVDDYPVTDSMLSTFDFTLMSGNISDDGGAWFSNKKNEILVFLLATDYHRVETFHFLQTDIPDGLIQEMELFYRPSGELVSLEVKKKHFPNFIKQVRNIQPLYFTSVKGFRLGDSIAKAIRVYGQPDSIQTEKGVKKLYWKFFGEVFYEGEDRKGKPVAKNNFGHQVTMFFRKDQLIAMILHNDIP